MKDIIKLLPGFNCGACGYSECNLFAEALKQKKAVLSQCTFINQEKFKQNKIKLSQLLKSTTTQKIKKKTIIGLIDKYKADFILKPLSKENSCRETLLPLSNISTKLGDLIRYRPLGCPIMHIAKIIEKEYNLITVHIVGPLNRIKNKEINIIDVGICLVLAFEGRIIGKLPSIGATVRFLPHHCMMQKIHSGVVVQLEKDKVRLEIIDLKIWAPPI